MRSGIFALGICLTATAAVCAGAGGGQPVGQVQPSLITNQTVLEAQRQSPPGGGVLIGRETYVLKAGRVLRRNEQTGRLVPALPGQPPAHNHAIHGLLARLLGAAQPPETVVAAQSPEMVAAAGQAGWPPWPPVGPQTVTQFVTADRLMTEYLDSESAAMQDFEGNRCLYLEGIVSTIRVRAPDGPYVKLRTPALNAEVECQFSWDYLNLLSLIEVGDAVNIRGFCEGRPILDVIVSDCRLVSWRHVERRPLTAAAELRRAAE